VSSSPIQSPARRTVPLLDLKLQYATIRDEVLAAVARVCEQQAFILGPEVTALERSVAAYSGSAHGIGVSSGTDALLLALMALDIGPGHEVLAPTFTFFATGGTIARTGAHPVFLDIDPVSYNLSPAAVRRFIAESCERRGDGLYNRASGRRVAALMPVHLYGQCADMAAFVEIARSHGLHLIEDAAQAIGAEDESGARAGSRGDIGCFSFFPTKNLGAFGDAGLCTAQDPDLAERMRVLRVHGGKPKYYHALIGGNFRIDELQAAVLNIKLRHLDAWTAGRQRNAAHYDALFQAAALAGHVRTPVAPARGRHIYNQYVIRAARRDELRAYLAEQGVGTEIYYPVPLHLQQCFAYLGGRAGDCPVAEAAARESLALPIFPELEPAQLEYVVDAIRRFYA
jgi:dTDP-4-amino-4,6-dideoxygalactose transaminase